MEFDKPSDFSITVDSDKLDGDRFASLWNIASASAGGDYAKTRMLSSRFLGFLCKKQCSFVIVSPSDASYLDSFFERDSSLLYDWSAESEKVDILAQHAYVPFDVFARFLEAEKFNPGVNHNPRRALRVDWFTNAWTVG